MCANGNPLRLNVLRQFPRKKKKNKKKADLWVSYIVTFMQAFM